MKIRVINKSEHESPAYKTEGSSGLDFRANLKKPITIKPLETVLIPTGIYMEIPKGYEGQLRARSGLSVKHGVTLINAVGTIDSDYRGEISIPLVNISNKEYTVENGDRIAQMIICKYEKVEELIEVDCLDETKRGSGGFGHTGKD